MSERIILWGAGTTGRVIARDLNAKGTPAWCFVDSDPTKYLHQMENLEVFSPQEALVRYPDATWVASAIHPPQHHEIMEEIAKMGVPSVPVWGFMPKRHNLPPNRAIETILPLLGDEESVMEFWNQIQFRKKPDYSKQRPFSDISKIYFEDFISKRDDEHFVDCGAADGDTVKDFLARWEKWEKITAFEPDPENHRKLHEVTNTRIGAYSVEAAVSDADAVVEFNATGDYSAHIGNGNSSVQCYKLDTFPFFGNPTFIKMDIEGSEPAALWGARRILKEHKPVLAICAYHEAEHLWTIPLLIHALQPEYKLFFRRYAEGTFELVWYGVPPGRVKA